VLQIATREPGLRGVFLPRCLDLDQRRKDPGAIHRDEHEVRDEEARTGKMRFRVDKPRDHPVVTTLECLIGVRKKARVLFDECVNGRLIRVRSEKFPPTLLNVREVFVEVGAFGFVFLPNGNELLRVLRRHENE
jgi:hypothetical protein